MGRFLQVFPCLAFAALAYWGWVSLVGPADIEASLDTAIFDWRIGALDPVHLLRRDLFVSSIFLLLFVEVVKSAHNGIRATLNHMLSVFLAFVCLWALVTLDGFETSTFLYITIATIFDVVAGFYITSRAKSDHGPIVVQSRGH